MSPAYKYVFQHQMTLCLRCCRIPSDGLLSAPHVALYFVLNAARTATRLGRPSRSSSDLTGKIPSNANQATICRMKWFRNPIAFTPLPVTIITSIVYLGLIIALLVTHLVVPSAPSSPTPVNGVNLTEAWHDLQSLTNGFHPYNSRRNDEVRDWLLRRIETILSENGATYTGLSMAEGSSTAGDGSRSNAEESTDVVIFNDMTSNITFSSKSLSVYFEGTNIIVYVRGNADEEGDWWTTYSRPKGPGGILVNAHYDSVSTGYGATDDGVGVVTVLQLIKFFTTPANRPEKGVVVSQLLLPFPSPPEIFLTLC